MCFSEASLIILIRWMPTINMGKAIWPAFSLSGNLQRILLGTVLRKTLLTVVMILVIPIQTLTELKSLRT